MTIKDHTISISDEDNYHLRIVLSTWLTDTKQMNGERTQEGQAVFNLWNKL